MKTILKLMPVFVAVFGTVVAFTLKAGAEENRVVFPGNFANYVRYGIFDRGSSGEEAFALPETIANSKNGQPLPDGTQLVLRILKNGELTSYFVMQKGEDWGADYDEERRTGDWQFQQFDTSMKVMASTNTAQCQSCHSNRESTEFMYTIDEMRAFQQ
jgi:cytochrome P460